jgi:hypothetical protein
MALLPINKSTRIKEKSVELDQINLSENSLSGDLIDGGTITHFSSTGIEDRSTQTQITVQDGVVEIAKDLHIKGKISADRLEYVSAQVPKLNVKNAVMIDNNEVLWKDTLGKIVKTSSLESVGILKNLQVSDTLFAADGRVGINTRAPSSEFSVLSNGHEIITRHTGETGYVGSHTHTPFSIGTDNTPRLTVKSNGDVTIDGNVGIGVLNPKESLEVAGNIKFSDKIFSSDYDIPTQGTWTTGSVVWNNKPAVGLAVGWVCIKGGTPGSWRPFGLIN